jgi:hypothetical protein
VEDRFIPKNLVSSVEGETEPSEVSEGAPASSDDGPVEQFEAFGLRDRLHGLLDRVGTQRRLAPRLSGVASQTGDTRGKVALLPEAARVAFALTEPEVQIWTEPLDRCEIRTKK